MDQKSLYERQVGSGNGSNTEASIYINARDKFIIDYINSNFHTSESDLNIAELSVGDGSNSRALLASLNNVRLTCVDISQRRLNLTSDAIS